MEVQRFDELAKRLATPITRRQAFKALAAAALGGLLIRSGTGRAWADEGDGNSACAHFCNNVYPPGPGQGQCKSDAAQGQGICTVCGPAAPEGSGPICGVQTDSPFCCASGETCCNNTTCANLQTDVQNCGACGHACGQGQKCVAGVCKSTTCVQLAQPCNSATDTCCQTSPGVTITCGLEPAGYFCCKPAGAPCTTFGSPEECCGKLSCIQGTCQ